MDGSNQVKHFLPRQSNLLFILQIFYEGINPERLMVINVVNESCCKPNPQ